MNENKMTGPESCKLFVSCSANLCPLDPKIKEKLWCPEENELGDICRNREFAGLQFIRTQKKIARATRNKRRERDDYFSFEMLNRNIVVRSGIEGIPDPPDSIKNHEKWYAEKERKSIESHPEKRPLSGEEIERRRLRMKSIRKTSSAIHFPEMTDSKGVINSPSLQYPLKSMDNGGNDE